MCSTNKKHRLIISENSVTVTGMNRFVGLFTEILRAEKREDILGSLENLTLAEWDEFPGQARYYGLMPLVYHRLKSLHLEDIAPPDTMRAFQHRYLSSAARNTLVFRQLSSILKKFNSHDICVIALKGAHIAEEIHGNTALRPMGDLDLLIRFNDLDKADELMVEMGYKPVENREYFREIHYHLAYDPPQHKVRVELHWDIINPSSPFQVDTDGLWSRARQTRINDVDTAVLAPEDLILHLCLHLAYSDAFVMGVKPLFDVDRTLRHFQDIFNWDNFYDRTLEWRAAKPVYLTLLMVNNYFRTEIPEEILHRLKPGDFHDDVVGWTERQINTVVEENPDRLPRVSLLTGPGTIPQKFTDLFRTIIPSRKFMSVRYSLPLNSPKLYVAYLDRLKTMFTKLFRNTLRGFHHTPGNPQNHPEPAKISLENWLGKEISKDYRL